MIETYIDIAFAISMISSFTKYPGPHYFSTVNHILKFLASSQDTRITFGGKSKFQIIRYFDFN